MRNIFLTFIRKILFKNSRFRFTFFGINSYSYVYTQPNGLSHYFGTYENEIKEFIISKSNNCNLIFNIGAAYGYYASYFSKKCHKVFLFEPNINSCNKLRELSKLLNFEFNIENKFVSNFDNENTISLNKCFEMYGIPDLIKVDIEGGEIDLLESSYDKIKENNISLIIELHSQAIENTIVKNLETNKIDYKIIDSYNRTKLVRKVDYMKWLII